MFDRALNRTQLSSARSRRLGVSLAAALGGGALFSVLELPLPWMLGPLTFSLAASMLQRPLERPQFLLLPMRAVLGVAIGAAFTPALLPKVGGVAGSLLLLIPYMAIVTVAGVVFLEKLAKFDRPTAFFSAAPGGLADMVIMSGDAGADVRRVTLVQASRLLMIIFVIPFWLQFVAGQPIGGAMPRTLSISELQFLDGVLIVALAWGGWRIATRVGLLGASMVGPLVLSAMAHLSGLTTVKVPIEVLILAQMTLGIVIGGQFSGVTLREFVTVLSWGLAFAVLLVVMAAAAALVVARITGLDSTSLLLSYSPGGQNEMAILALVMGLDVAIIALHQLLRVAMVVIGAQMVFKSHKSWRRPSPDQ
jgi:membrane AbrB-like protein